MIDPSKIWSAPQLPTLPAVAVRLVELSKQPDLEIRDVIELIKADPAISAKILKSTNSSFFGFTSEVTSIDRAVPLLGTTMVTSLALSFSLTDMAMKTGSLVDHYQSYWTQSVIQGIADHMGQGIGKADDLPATFTDANVRWKVDLGGKGHSSPVLWGQKLFLTRMTGEKGRRELVCLDARTGEELWATECEFTPHHQHRFNSFAAATPAVDANGVHLIWTSGKILVAVAFDHSGKRKWRRELGSFQAMHGFGTSPVLFEDLMIVANDNEGESSLREDRGFKP